MAFTFEWDPGKTASNARKHGFSFDEAATAFVDSFGRIVEDPRHSSGEPRFALLGYSEDHRLLAVMFTERGDCIRLISARKATRHEPHDYEEGKR